jgi:HAD superfamily hydrolase (TIGR01490 family)
MPAYLALFDLDHTLLNTNSGKVLVQQGYKGGVLGKRLVLQAFYISLLYKSKLRNPVEIIRDMGTLLKGIPEAQICELAELTFKDKLNNFIRPEIRSEIEAHRKLGAEIGILSSAISQVCEPIARHLNIETLLCTHMEVRGNLFTGLPLGDYCYGIEKLNVLQTHCIHRNISLQDCWYYADDDSDIPVLSAVGHPVCVNPGRKLKKLASTMNWKKFG